MPEQTRDPVPPTRLDELSRLVATASSSAAVEAAIRWFGQGAELYVVDHEFSRLVNARDAADTVALVGEHRTATQRAARHFDGTRTWIPLPERQQVIFSVAVAGEHGADEFAVDAVGAVLSTHRRRFEDLERIRRRSQMAVAAELQWDLLPVRADELGAYQLAGILEPAYDVAGDVFEFAMHGDVVDVYSFDGMGHGLDATITSVLVLAAVRNSRREGGSLSDQMQLANDILWQQYGGDRFVTGVACRLDPDGGVEIVNAGHEPVRVVSAGRVERLDLDVDLPLGVHPDPTYRSQRAASLSPGDGLVLFSDGPAAQTSEGSAYGDDHLDEVLAGAWSDVPLQTSHVVIDDVLDFIGSGHVDDDVTAVVVRRSDEASAGS